MKRIIKRDIHEFIENFLNESNSFLCPIDPLRPIKRIYRELEYMSVLKSDNVESYNFFWEIHFVSHLYFSQGMLSVPGIAGYE